MSAARSSGDVLDGLLVAVISGGRPKVSQRPVHKFLPTLPAGMRAVTVVSSHEADRYEWGDTDPVVFEREWAVDYARDHWVHVKPAPEPGSDMMLGAFVGREAACREAERRGCWGVLQLDDNIKFLRLLAGTPGKVTAARLGGLAYYTEVLARIALGSNARMVGAHLDAVISRERPVVARTGFCYSMFIEKVGQGREPWYGPVEDDIQHAFQYGTRAEDGTVAVVPLLRYKKESQSATGMRKMYDHTRAVPLQRLRPEAAEVRLMAAKANGRGGPRVFHRMKRGAIENPLLVTDQAEWDEARKMLRTGVEMFRTNQRDATRAKLRRRTSKHYPQPRGPQW